MRGNASRIIATFLVEKVTKINAYHLEQFAYFIKRLKSIQEGDGTLLDHCLIVYGSAHSNGKLQGLSDV